jgi:hypothetical protein
MFVWLRKVGYDHRLCSVAWLGRIHAHTDSRPFITLKKFYCRLNIKRTRFVFQSMCVYAIEATKKSRFLLVLVGPQP